MDNLTPKLLNTLSIFDLVNQTYRTYCIIPTPGYALHLSMNGVIVITTR